MGPCGCCTLALYIGHGDSCVLDCWCMPSYVKLLHTWLPTSAPGVSTMVYWREKAGLSLALVELIIRQILLELLGCAIDCTDIAQIYIITRMQSSYCTSPMFDVEQHTTSCSVKSSKHFWPWTAELSFLLPNICRMQGTLHNTSR